MFIAEIGINHNGDLDLAKKLIDSALLAGVDVVKFQKRDLELAIPLDQREQIRETPWGQMTYMEYKKKIEFGKEQYDEIAAYCKSKSIRWTASVWDINSLNFLLNYDIPFIKIPSACVTDIDLLKAAKESKLPIIMSTGMSTIDEIRAAVSIFEKDYPLTLLYCKSSYPTPDSELNLNGMLTLKKEFGFKVGFSGHEDGVTQTLSAVILGAEVIERHITLNKRSWGTDQTISMDPGELRNIINNIKRISVLMGSGEISVQPSELPNREKLRNKK
jgi:N-acetylneuraminate synthase